MVEAASREVAATTVVSTGYGPLVRRGARVRRWHHGGFGASGTIIAFALVIGTVGVAANDFTSCNRRVGEWIAINQVSCG